MADPTPDAVIRCRLSPADARYAGRLVPGSKAVEIFGDLETEIALREGGDEGLCAEYHSVRFHAPLRVGDYVEATATVVRRGRRSRLLEARLYSVLRVDDEGRMVSDERVLAAEASVTIVVGQPGEGADDGS